MSKMVLVNSCITEKDMYLKQYTLISDLPLIFALNIIARTNGVICLWQGVVGLYQEKGRSWEIKIAGVYL